MLQDKKKNSHQRNWNKNIDETVILVFKESRASYKIKYHNSRATIVSEVNKGGYVTVELECGKRLPWRSGHWSLEDKENSVPASLLNDTELIDGMNGLSISQKRLKVKRRNCSKYYV